MRITLAKPLAVLLAAMIFSLPAAAAGLDSRSYSCRDLHALIAANRFIFIGNPDFQDFVVRDVSMCEAGGLLQLRTVPTSDTPQCPVNYCIPAPNAERF